MSSALEALVPASRPATRPATILASWAALGIVLLAEVLFLTLRFDTSPFAARSDWASRIIAATPEVLRAAISAASACLALIAWRLWPRFGLVCRDSELVTGIWPWLPVQLVSFAVLLPITAHVLGPTTPISCLEVLCWLAVAAWTGLCGMAAAVPLRFWRILIGNGRAVIVMSAAIGLGTWAIGQLAQLGWQSTAAPTFWLVDGLLRLVYSEVSADPERFVVGTPLFRVRIAAACSGYEGVCLVGLYLGAYLIAFRRTLHFPLALWLIPIGGLAAWSANVLRITVLVMIGDAGSPELALGGFHSQAGWLAFNAVALGVIVVARQSRIFTAHPIRNEVGTNPAAVYLLPLLAITAAGMLIEALSNGSPTLDPLRVTAGAVVLLYYRRSIRSRLRSEHGERGGIGWAVLAGVGVFGLWMAFNWGASDGNRWPDPRIALNEMASGEALVWLVFRVAGSVLVAPVAEELAFRGYLLRRLIAADFEAVSPRRFTGISFLVSSCLFGILHGNWLAGMLAGMAYAVVLYRRGRLGDCVLAHAVTNGLLTLTALITGNWRVWS